MRKKGKHQRTADNSMVATSRLFFQGTCRCDGLEFHFLADNSMNIIHLTFTLESHIDAAARLSRLLPDSRIVRDEQCRAHLCHLFHEYLSGNLQHVPYSLQSPFYEEGTDFQKKVWKRISRIGFGKTKTYGELARALGSIRLARAVGRACHRNPLALVIPCHRVVGSNGIGGFTGGSSIKSMLLAIEKGEQHLSEVG